MAAITDGGPVLDSYMARIPLGRVGTVEDVAHVVRFLCGPESVWITGQCISVDGGQSLRGGADFSAFAEPAHRDDPGWKLVTGESSGAVLGERDGGAERPGKAER